MGLKQEADPHAANDDPPDPHALDAAATGEAGEDKLELVEQPRKVNSEAISYARVAKKIDVIALKRALSHQITSSSVRSPAPAPRNRFRWPAVFSSQLTRFGLQAQPQEKEGVSFKNLLHKLPSRIKDKRTLEDLSVQARHHPTAHRHLQLNLKESPCLLTRAMRAGVLHHAAPPGERARLRDHRRVLGRTQRRRRR